MRMDGGVEYNEEKKKKILGDEVFFKEMVENFTSLARYHKAL